MFSVSSFVVIYASCVLSVAVSLSISCVFAVTLSELDVSILVYVGTKPDIYPTPVVPTPVICIISYIAIFIGESCAFVFLHAAAIQCIASMTLVGMGITIKMFCAMHLLECILRK